MNTAIGNETCSTSSETVGDASAESAAKHLGNNTRTLTMYEAMRTCGNKPDETSDVLMKTLAFSNLLLRKPW